MFSLLHEFLGRVYRLITWSGGFNFRPGLVYFGMGRISLWAELLGWICAPIPFIRRRSGLTLWACALIVFYPISGPPQPLVEISLGEGWLVSWIGCDFHVAI